VKGFGIGKLLISSFLSKMHQNGIQRICLSTDRDNNAPTLGFYEGLGFTRVREVRTTEGRWICEYVIATK
jgi:ribosomal protein S18 acetylase RimI-like enzyme